MKGAAKEHWMELCEHAANEQDPKKLMVLIAEMTRLLEQNKHGSMRNRPKS
jgi:hypothetical protein